MFMNDVTISLETVRLFKRIMRPVAEEGIIPLPEFNEVISQLTSLAEHGKPKPLDDTHNIEVDIIVTYDLPLASLFLYRSATFGEIYTGESSWALTSVNNFHKGSASGILTSLPVLNCLTKILRFSRST